MAWAWWQSQGARKGARCAGQGAPAARHPRATRHPRHGTATASAVVSTATYRHVLPRTAIHMQSVYAAAAQHAARGGSADDALMPSFAPPPQNGCTHHHDATDLLPILSPRCPRAAHSSTRATPTGPKPWRCGDATPPRSQAAAHRRRPASTTQSPVHPPTGPAAPLHPAGPPRPAPRWRGQHPPVASLPPAWGWPWLLLGGYRTTPLLGSDLSSRSSPNTANTWQHRSERVVARGGLSQSVGCAVSLRTKTKNDDC